MRIFKLLLVTLFSIAVAACGGGGGSSTTTPTPTISTLSGTAATGKAIASATVTIKGANGVKITTATDTFGKYPATSVATLTAPYLLKVTAAGTNLYSVATAAGTANIHPFTDLIIRNWYKVKGSDVETEFNGTLTPANIPTPAEINTIKAVVKNILTTWLAKEGVSSFDLISTPFNADSTGFDKVLDNTKVTIATTVAGTVTVTTTDPTTGGVSTLATTTISTNLATTPADTTSPTDPTGLTASPASTTSILLTWTASTDAVGVAGYNIYRGATKIGTSPYPSYSDTGLMSATSYCYQVEAFDVAGNVSAKAPITAVCAMPPTSGDTIAPAAPTGLTATAASASQINLTWAASTDNVGVVGYDVYRGVSKVATVNGTSYSDTGLSSSTLYSYTVKAKDAALNVSAASSAASATTSLGIPAAPTGVTATAAVGQATISWTAVNGAATYNIYMATQTGVTKANYLSLLGQMAHTNVTSPFVHIGLTDGTTYYFVVTAVNTAGESIESNQVSATPTSYSISGAVSGAIMSGVTITVTGAATPTPVTTATNGSYSIAGLANGNYTVTPSLAGYTFSPTSTAVTIASGMNVTGKNFTATANSAVLATVSGTVTGAWIEGVTITMGGAGSGTTTTNASGAYSFPNVASGATYSFTPSLLGYTYSASPSVTIPGGNAAPVTVPAIVASSAIASASISGTVTNNSGKTGRIYILAYNTNCIGCSPVASTSIAGAGSYTLRGLQGNNFYVEAQVDAQGTGVRNATNPVGGASAGAGGSGVNITINPITAPVAVTPTGLQVSPSDGAAMIFWDTVRNTGGLESVAAYKIYWGTDVNATSGTPVIVIAGDNGFDVQSGTVGSTRYYKVSSCSSSNCAAGTESASSAVVGPITLNAPTIGNTVSGTVSVVPGTTAAPMIVGLYSNTGIYFTRIANPSNAQAYTITGVPNGDYANFAFIDKDKNGYVSAGDITNIGTAIPPKTVNSNVTGSDITLSSASGTARVSTDHEGTNYNLLFKALSGSKQAVAATVISGANMPVPFDFGVDPLNDATWMWTGGVRPTVGDSYKIRVTYSDGTTQDITSSVNAVLDSFATNLVAQTTTPGTPAIPLFTWAAPLSPPASYSYQVSLYGNNVNWWLDSRLPSSATSVLYNVDNRATVGGISAASLPTGTYTWEVDVRDSNGNRARQLTSYTAP